MKKNKAKGVLKEKRIFFSIEKTLKSFFTAFFATTVLALMSFEGSYTELGFVQNEISGSGEVYLIFILVLTLGFMVLDYYFERYRAVELSMLLSSFLVSFLILSEADGTDKYKIFAAVLVVNLIVLNYVLSRDAFAIIPDNFDKRIKWGTISLFAVISFVIVSLIGIYRYASYSAPNFDFGIWCNMFHNMKETGLPVTTCERDGLLSHFAVHFSPIYYVMLPFYAIVPRPETLQVLQAAVLYSGVVPLCLIAKNRGLSDKNTIALSAVYCAYPAIATGTFYDLHENCFLLPLLLWVFYFFEKEKNVPMWTFVALTLLVKEDAFIYVLIFAVYVFFATKKKLTSLVLTGVSTLYFVIVSTLMEMYGNGIMTSRYANLSLDGSLLGVIRTVIFNPSFLMTQLFETSKEGMDKVLYVTLLMLPLCFLPFVSKRISTYILCVPVLLNIITMYAYQPNINYQYSFGITAFLLYAAAINLSELPWGARSYTLGVSLVSGVLLFSMLVCGNLGYYSSRYYDNKEVTDRIDYALSEVLPKDESVAASAFLLPHVADRSEIYQTKYHKTGDNYKTDVSYVVLDMRAGYKAESEKVRNYYLENGYEELYFDEGAIVILEKK